MNRDEQDPLLRAAFGAVRGGREVMTPPAGFAERVVAATRALPSREAMIQADRLAADLGATVVRLCRRIVLAAIVLFALGLAFASGLLDGGGAGTVEAAPDEVQRELDRLDALLSGQREQPRPEVPRGRDRR
jgi:hypothetical protein